MVYWSWVGRPVSVLKGTLADFLPINLSELVLWVGLGSTVGLIYLWTPPGKKWARRLFSPTVHPGWVSGGLFLAGPILLIFQASGQGALPFHLNPTGFRPSLHKVLSPPPLDSSTFSAFADSAQNWVPLTFDSLSYANLNSQKILEDCNSMIEGTLQALNLPGGRTVRRIKNLSGISRILGLSYGGPAYHDPLTGEVGIADYDDLPATKAWQMRAACHEIAHAKGYGREMDAEIITQLALLRAPDPLYQFLGYQMFLHKSHIKYAKPGAILAEENQVKADRKRVFKEQVVITRLKEWAKKTRIHNKAEKYGDLGVLGVPPGDHPFFSTVLYLFHLPLKT